MAKQNEYLYPVNFFYKQNRPWHENAWFGVTVTRKAELWRIDALRKNVRAGISITKRALFPNRKGNRAVPYSLSVSDSIITGMALFLLFQYILKGDTV